MWSPCGDQANSKAPGFGGLFHFYPHFFISSAIISLAVTSGLGQNRARSCYQLGISGRQVSLVGLDWPEHPLGDLGHGAVNQAISQLAPNVTTTIK